MAASALAPGTHLLPVPLRFPLPARQPPPCPGEKRGSHYPANSEAVARCLSGGRLEFVTEIQEDNTSISPSTWGETNSMIFSSHTHKKSPGQLALAKYPLPLTYVSRRDEAQRKEAFIGSSVPGAVRGAETASPLGFPPMAPWASLENLESRCKTRA